MLRIPALGPCLQRHRIPLTVASLLNTVVAGAAMALSSVSVVSNALLLRGWKRQGQSH